MPEVQSKKDLLKLAVSQAMNEMPSGYFAIKVRMEGYPYDEIIVNDIKNMEQKMAYWDKTYGEDLVHNFSKGIAIVGFRSAYTYLELQLNLSHNIEE